MILGQTVDVVVEGTERRRGEEGDLAHRSLAVKQPLEPTSLNCTRALAAAAPV